MELFSTAAHNRRCNLDLIFHDSLLAQVKLAKIVAIRVDIVQLEAFVLLFLICLPLLALGSLVRLDPLVHARLHVLLHVLRLVIKVDSEEAVLALEQAPVVARLPQLYLERRAALQSEHPAVEHGLLRRRLLVLIHVASQNAHRRHDLSRPALVVLLVVLLAHFSGVVAPAPTGLF